MKTMIQVHNFNAGPSILPHQVLLQAQEELLDYAGSGMSIMESSHRGAEYTAVHEEAESNLRELMGVSDEYAVLFLQGGASQQFAQIPMNLLGEGQVADYTLSGAWAAKAAKEARIIGKVHIAADCAKEFPTRVPRLDELDLTDGAAYLHLTSNETISGAQWKQFPKVEAPVIADMSSDILSRPIAVDDFGMIYAGAQKNIGPAGLAVVILRKDLAERAPDTLPTIFRYKTQIENHSLYNTPPTFGIYLVMLVTRWVKEQGGVAGLEKINAEKAERLYAAIDETGFYRGTAAKECRSHMNVTFRLTNEDLEPAFIKQADEAGMKGLKGHRSVGGLRASIYNAMPIKGIDALVAFMQEFERTHG